MTSTGERLQEGNPWVELCNDLLRCELVPAVGGAISGLWYRGVPVLRSGPAMDLQSARKGGCFALVPYSNRIGNGEMHWKGKVYQLPTTSGDEPHSIHGVGWQRAWSVVNQTADSVQLAYRHQPDGHWPFPFLAAQTISIDGGDLVLQLSYRNTGDEPAPVGLGWHPYFDKRAGARVSFHAGGRWETATDKLPTYRADCTGVSASCADLTVDHCYEGWAGKAELRDERLCIGISSDTNYLVMFTHPGVSFVAIEPVTHVSNAQQLAVHAGVNMQAFGMRELGANQVMHCNVRVRVSEVGCG